MKRGVSLSLSWLVITNYVLKLITEDAACQLLFSPSFPGVHPAEHSSLKYSTRPVLFQRMRRRAGMVCCCTKLTEIGRIICAYPRCPGQSYAWMFHPTDFTNTLKRRDQSCPITAIRATSWLCPAPGRPWRSSRWRPPTTCVYLHHLKDCRKNVIKIYLNRRIIPQKSPHCAQNAMR